MRKVTLDWNEYIDKARKAVAEGNVLVKNSNQVLPLKEQSKLAVFGRIQNNYYKSGTGSGGMVNVDRVIGIVDALRESEKVQIDEVVSKAYEEFELTHPFDQGIGWGQEPWFQEEMELQEAFVEDAAKRNEVGLVIIGRTAGEDKDNLDVPGAYRLSSIEEHMLYLVRKHFAKMVVVLNVGNIIDMSFVDQNDPDAVLYAWQGGMIGGLGTADVLLGQVSPSGKLPDTITYSLNDYPAHECFGDVKANDYKEDIYVGYRYFETVAKDKVRYPFGFGLSYTTFEQEYVEVELEEQDVRVKACVKNTGAVAGKEVVQVYIKAPQGKLGKPARVLGGFAKTKELKPGEQEKLEIIVPARAFASYDDSGVTNHPYCFLLEEGKYEVYVGNDVREASLCGEFILPKDVVIEQLQQALPVPSPMKRMKMVENNGTVLAEFEDAPFRPYDGEALRQKFMPEDVAYTGNQGITLLDVKNNKADMMEFLAQISDEELSCMIRGEGMGSPKVTPGTAGAFGGVTKKLQELGIPCDCCSDGPSGMRLDCGTKAFSLPNGTLLAATFNEALLEELYELVGLEMVCNKVDTLLGSGMNIHRFPLNGRNFEYFSEDPFLTGKMAAAQLKGMHKVGVTGTIKHFCGNNQEASRYLVDSRISERALREIYLYGFEIAVKEAKARSIMTTYGSVNGIFTASNIDLNTTILREEWGFDGIVMTDWWATMNDVPGQEATKGNFAAMIRAQNDLYMVCPDSCVNSYDDNTLSSLEEGTLTRGELIRSAKNIATFAMNSIAFDRMFKTDNELQVTIINGVHEEGQELNEVVYHKIENKEITIDLSKEDTSKGSCIVFAVEAEQLGHYHMTVTGRSEFGPLAQMPMTIFMQSVSTGMITWNGTQGQWVEKEAEVLFASKYIVFRFYFAQSGVELKDFHLEFVKDISEAGNHSDYLCG